MSPERYKDPDMQPHPGQIFEAAGEFIEHFGIEVSPYDEPDKFLEAISQLNPRFKGGQDLVRYKLEQDQTKWSDDDKELIERTAKGMRMLEHETSLHGHFDVVVVLGGARQANLDRLQYAVEALNSGQASIDYLIVAGNTRKLDDDEKENVANYAPSAETEIDLLKAAAEKVKSENPGLEIGAFDIEHILPDGQKTGTPDVLKSLFDTIQSVGVIKHGSRVAAVTTQIYQASTSLDIARVGKEFGLNTMAAGNPSDPKIIEARKPATYLSEIFRTLRASTLAAQAEKR